MAVSFAVQAVSHFVINASHYASISFMRDEPIMALGILTMILQGVAMGWLYPRVKLNESWLWNGLQFSLVFGLVLGLYIALAEPAKYAVDSVGSWIVVELIASTIQFAAFGALLGFIHRDRT